MAKKHTKREHPQKGNNQMTDPIKVRFPCDHNFWFKHFIPGSRYVWCDGGTTRRLRAASEFNRSDFEKMTDVWVEVDVFAEVDGDE